MSKSSVTPDMFLRESEWCLTSRLSTKRMSSCYPGVLINVPLGLVLFFLFTHPSLPKIQVLALVKCHIKSKARIFHLLL